MKKIVQDNSNSTRQYEKFLAMDLNAAFPMKGVGSLVGVLGGHESGNKRVKRLLITGMTLNRDRKFVLAF
jgi:hypothetical protein